MSIVKQYQDLNLMNWLTNLQQDKENLTDSKNMVILVGCIKLCVADYVEIIMLRKQGTIHFAIPSSMLFNYLLQNEFWIFLFLWFGRRSFISECLFIVFLVHVPIIQFESNLFLQKIWSASFFYLMNFNLIFQLYLIYCFKIRIY